MLLYSLLCYLPHYPSNSVSLFFSSCSVFLLDRVSHELVAKVFDGGVVSDEEVQHTHIDAYLFFHNITVYLASFLLLK